MRTRESVVLGQARKSIFASDPYIQRRRSKSILCLPIRYPDNRDGVLYLENSLTSGAINSDRLEVLEMVFSRMVNLKLWQLQDNAQVNCSYWTSSKLPKRKLALKIEILVLILDLAILLER